MSKLQLPSGENLILSALGSLAESGRADPTELAAEYARRFVSAAQPAQGRCSVFDRFSLADPTIRMVIKSTSTPL